MFYLWLITGILGYAHRIPYIGRIVSLLGLWYGRTTWWKILVKIRKVFIIFNAIIGVFVVFKTTGFTPDLLLNNIVMMGHTYFEIFTNLTKRLFTWFFDLFDHKIVPNVPGDKPSINKPSIHKPDTSGIWVPRGVDQGWNQRLPKLDIIPSDWFKSSINFNINPTPWYKEYTTWLWIGGTLCTIGGLYFGYKLIIDPTFIDSMSNSGTSTAKASPIDPSGSGSVADGGSNPILNGIITVTKSINNGVKKLNPLYWFMSSTDTSTQFQSFINTQNDIARNNMNLYPFTVNNPYDSWITRMRIHWLGETTYEEAIRMRLRETAMSEVYKILDTKTIPESPLLGGTLTPLTGFNSGFSTPKVGTVGLNQSYRSTMLKLMHKLNKLLTFFNKYFYILPILSLFSKFKNNKVFSTINIIIKMLMILNIVMGVAIIVYFTDFITPVNTTFSIYNDLLEPYIEIIKSLWNKLINTFNNLINNFNNLEDSQIKKELQSVLNDSSESLTNNIKGQVKEGMKEAIDEALAEMQEDKVNSELLKQLALISSGLLFVYFFFILPGTSITPEDLAQYNWINQSLIEFKINIINYFNNKPGNPGTPSNINPINTVIKDTVDVGVSPITPSTSTGSSIATITQNSPVTPVASFSEFFKTYESGVQTDTSNVTNSIVQTDVSGSALGMVVAKMHLLNNTLPQEVLDVANDVANNRIKSITD